MYIYHVENVQSGQGGRLYFENPQICRFWPFSKGGCATNSL